MNQLSLSFRLRPVLIAGAFCIFLSPAVSATAMSHLPQLTSPASTIQNQAEPSLPLSCDASLGQRTALLTYLTTALSVAARSQAEPGFVHIADIEETASADAGPVSRGLDPDGSDQSSDALNVANSEPETPLTLPPQAKPGKLSYIKGLPHAFAEKSKALSAHISKKFNVDLEHAHQVVSYAMVTASKTGLPPTLLLAVIAVESSFKASARNGNARGLMQIIPFWHREKVAAAGGPDELMKVDKNIAAGSAILKEYIDRNGSVRKGLVRYNASAHAKQYSEKVIKQKNWFETVMSLEQ